MATTRTRKTKATTAPRHRVRIRMYRHGLGDCFLLSFTTRPKGYFHMLIDCGIVLGTTDPASVMNLVAADIKAETGGALDALVITHEHWDHLSGFDESQARKIFDAISVKQLWLAWTEEPGNALADALREERRLKKEAAKTAKKALEKTAANASSAKEKKRIQARAEALSSLLGFFGAKASDGDSEEDAGSGTGGALEYLKGRCAPTIVRTGSLKTLPAVEGLRIYAMGPPEDRDALRKANPRKNEGYGLGAPSISLADAFLAAFDPRDELSQPFDKRLRRDLAELPAPAPAPGKPPTGLAAYRAPERVWRTIDHDWLDTGARLALQLDSATNNTSLVLAFELDDEDVLLFVGDAQAGNWRSWDSLEWKIKDGTDDRRTVTATDLLNRTIFYKVGHHGSHNATLREKGLEKMTNPRLAAFIPVDTEVAHQVKGWKHMPLPAIRDRLEKKCAFVFQSDAAKPYERKPGSSVWKDSKKTFAVKMKDKKTGKEKTVRTQPLYTDYYV